MKLSDESKNAFSIWFTIFIVTTLVVFIMPWVLAVASYNLELANNWASELKQSIWSGK